MLVKKPDEVPEILNKPKKISKSKAASDEADEAELLRKGFREEIMRNYGPDYWWYEDHIY